VIHNGPLPFFLHGALDYLAGALLIVAPFLFGFSSGAATAVSIVAGVAVLVLAASTRGPTSLTKSVPVPVHIILDVAAGALFIAAPFLFGFSTESAPTAFFIALGVMEILIVVATRFPREPRTVPGDPEGDGLPYERHLDPDT
jgi:VIT1/CCC1 family predicted Fe2+/Mn2+ transporter